MRKIGVIFLVISVFIFQFEYSALASSKLKKYAIEVIKKELHDQLQKRLNGVDVPVENVLQAIDFIANGEFDRAKNVAKEEFVSQTLGILVGSGGAAIIGVAWNFAKNTFTSIQNWGKNTELKGFVKEFLNHEIEQWRNRKAVPAWKDEVRRMNDWIDTYSVNLGALQFFKDKKKYLEEFREEAWRKTIEIHTRYRRYFYSMRKAQLAAERARRAFWSAVRKQEMHYRRVLRILKLAKERPTIKNIHRYDTNRTYRFLVVKVASINRIMPPKHRITIREFVSVLKQFNGLTKKRVKDICLELKKAFYPVNDETVRMFAGNKSFRKGVIKKASSLNFQRKDSGIDAKALDSIYENILDINPYEFKPLVQSDEDKFYKNMEKMKKQAFKSSCSNLNSLLNTENKLVRSYSAGDITFLQFLDMSNYVYGTADRFCNASSESKERFQAFKKAFYSYLNKVAKMRADAMRTLNGLKNEICKKDDILQKTRKSFLEIKDKLNGSFFDNVSLESVYTNAKYCKYDLTSSIYLIKQLKSKKLGYTNTLITLSEQIYLSSKALKELNDYTKQYYDEMFSLVQKYRDEADRLGYLTDFYPYKYDGLISYKDLYTEPACKVEVEKHYSKAVKILDNLENTNLYAAVAYQQLLCCLNFVNIQISLNESIASVSNTLLNRFKYRHINSLYDEMTKDKNFISDTIFAAQTMVEAYDKNMEIMKEYGKTDINYALSEAKNNIIAKYYIPLSEYESRLSHAKYKAVKYCSTVKQLLSHKKTVMAWRRMLSSLRNNVIIIDKNIESLYSKALDVYIPVDKEDKDRCEVFKSEIYYLQRDIARLKKAEKELYRQLTNDNYNIDEFRYHLYKAKALPFKPFFDISLFEKKFKRYVTGEGKISFKPPSIESLYFNGNKFYRYITVIPVQLKGKYIQIIGHYKVYNDPIKSVYYKIGIRKNKCSVDKNSYRFVCLIGAPNASGTYPVSFRVNGKHSTFKHFIFIQYKSHLSEVDRFIKAFETTYNSGKSLEKFFPRGSSLTDAIIKISYKNRKILHQHIEFSLPKIVKFRTFENDPDSRWYRAVVKINWRSNLPNCKKGTVFFTVERFYNIPIIRRTFLITKIEGDSFLTCSGTNKPPTNTIKQVKIAIISHVGARMGGGYSLDFESGKYYNKEMDIAAGFVNPKVKGYEKPYFNVGMLKDMGNVGLSNVSVCPKSGYSDYNDYTPARVGHTYCVRTQEGHYAKIRVIKTGGVEEKAFIKFEWVYGGNSNRF